MQVRFVVISSMLLAASGCVQAAPIPRDLGSDISRIVQDVERVANDVASVASGVIADLPPFLQTPASSIFNEVTAGAAKGFAEVTSILGDFITIAPPTPTPTLTRTPKATTTQTPAFQVPGTPLTTSNPFGSLFDLPPVLGSGTLTGFSSTKTISPSDLSALLSQLLSQNGDSGALRSGASFSISYGSPISSTLVASSTLASSSSASSPTASVAVVPPPSPSVAFAPSSSSSTPTSSTTTSSVVSTTSTTSTVPAIGGVTMTAIAAPVTLPGQPVTSISSGASATGSVYPNVPSKRGLGSLIGIVGTELGPLLQEVDQLGNKVASIGNKVIAALPSEIQAPASSFFAEATAEVGKGFGFVTSIAGPVLAAAPTPTSTTSSSATTTPAPQNLATKSNDGMSVSPMAVNPFVVAASVALGALVAL